MLRRLLLILVALVIVLLVAAFLWLGSFPPKPHVQTVDHNLPIDRVVPPPATPVLPPVQAPEPGGVAPAPAPAPTPAH